MGEGEKGIQEESTPHSLGREQGQGEAYNNGSKKQIMLCPMCNGKGYYEEMGKPEVINQRNDETSVMLPSIGHQNPPYKLEQIFKVNDSKVLSAGKSDTAVPMTVLKLNTRFPPVNIQNCNGRKSQSTTTAGRVKNLAKNNKISTFPQLNLLPPNKQLEKHPEDVARFAANKLNMNEWEKKRQGLEECLQLARLHPEELEPYMSLVYRALSSLLGNFRPQVAMFGCQAARELLARMRSTCRPEYDELVHTLLSRTADTNKYVRLQANDALDKMVTYIPTTHAVRPLVEKGPIHKNPLVRTATARLLTCIVALKTPNTMLTQPNLREPCKRVLETAALLLGDGNLDTRAAAKKLFQRFMNEEEFESVYYAEVDETLRKRIDRAFVELRYKKHAQA